VEDATEPAQGEEDFLFKVCVVDSKYRGPVMQDVHCLSAKDAFASVNASVADHMLKGSLLQTVVRIFDSLLIEGSKMLHRIALALFQLAEKDVMCARDTVEVSTALQKVTRSAYNRDELMRIATSKIGPLSRKLLEKLRAVARVELGFDTKAKVGRPSGSSSVRAVLHLGCRGLLASELHNTDSLHACPIAGRHVVHPSIWVHCCSM
jgi:hypothetical protein